MEMTMQLAEAITETQPITTVLERLTRPERPTGPVLSVFLDTSPTRLTRQAHLLALRDGFKATRVTLSAGEQRPFEAAARQVEQYVVQHRPFTHPGLALFAAPAAGLFYATALPRSLADEVVWSEQPAIEPLQQIVDDGEQVAAVLFDQRHARIFTFYLGELESQRELEDDVPGRTSVGGWYGLAQARLARHREDHVLRHARRTIAALLDVWRRSPFDRLVLAGHEEALSLLRRHLPLRLQTRIAATLHLPVSAPEDEVVGAVLRVAAEVEQRDEQAAVRELLEAPAQRAVNGVAGTLDALGSGQVHLLVVADRLTANAAECPTCGRLVADGNGGADRCPACGERLRPADDLRDLAVRRAAAQGASVEVVSGEAADLLLERGGIGAWVRS
jgi:hypothetical protein